MLDRRPGQEPSRGLGGRPCGGRSGSQHVGLGTDLGLEVGWRSDWSGRSFGMITLHVLTGPKELGKIPIMMGRSIAVHGKG